MLLIIFDKVLSWNSEKLSKQFLNVESAVTKKSSFQIQWKTSEIAVRNNILSLNLNATAQLWNDTLYCNNFFKAVCI